MRKARDEWLSKNDWQREKFRVYASSEGWEKRYSVVKKRGATLVKWSVLSPDTGKWWSVGQSVEPLTEWGRSEVRKRARP